MAIGTHRVPGIEWRRGEADEHGNKTYHAVGLCLRIVPGYTTALMGDGLRRKKRPNSYTLEYRQDGEWWVLCAYARKIDCQNWAASRKLRGTLIADAEAEVRGWKGED